MIPTDDDMMDYLPLDVRLRRAKEKARQYYTPVSPAKTEDWPCRSLAMVQAYRDSPELRAQKRETVEKARAMRGRAGRHTR